MNDDDEKHLCPERSEGGLQGRNGRVSPGPTTRIHGQLVNLLDQEKGHPLRPSGFASANGYQGLMTVDED